MKKTILLFLLLSILIPSHLFSVSPISNNSLMYDARCVISTTISTSLGILGIWIIKKSIDKMLDTCYENESIPMKEKLVALSAESFATFIGLLCSVGGSLLVVMDSYKVKCKGTNY